MTADTAPRMTRPTGFSLAPPPANAGRGGRGAVAGPRRVTRTGTMPGWAPDGWQATEGPRARVWRSEQDAIPPPETSTVGQRMVGQRMGARPYLSDPLEGKSDFQSDGQEIPEHYRRPRSAADPRPARDGGGLPIWTMIVHQVNAELYTCTWALLAGDVEQLLRRREPRPRHRRLARGDGWPNLRMDRRRHQHRGPDGRGRAAGCHSRHDGGEPRAGHGCPHRSS
jgi:hypothetical protein